jgi:hypothetical protein
VQKRGGSLPGHSLTRFGISMIAGFILIASFHAIEAGGYLLKKRFLINLRDDP